MGRALRYTRVVVEAVLALLLSAALLWPGKLTEMLGGWIARVQLIPMALAMSVGWFALWIVLTLIFGRVYCSTVCPLGALQDLLGLLRRFAGKKEFHYQPPYNNLRYVALAVAVVILVTGVSVAIVIVDPYTVYSRMLLSISRPAQASILGLAGSLVALLAIGVIAIWRGRLICNTICPVGTTLGVVSRYSIFHIDIDTDLCTQCRACEHVCKAECVDLIDHVVDSSRCVNCFDCLTVCEHGAIKYTPTRKQLSIPMMMRATSLQNSSSSSMQNNASSSMQNPDNINNDKHETIS